MRRPDKSLFLVGLGILAIALLAFGAAYEIFRLRRAVNQRTPQIAEVEKAKFRVETTDQVWPTAMDKFKGLSEWKDARFIGAYKLYVPTSEEWNDSKIIVRPGTIFFYGAEDNKSFFFDLKIGKQEGKYLSGMRNGNYAEYLYDWDAAAKGRHVVFFENDEHLLIKSEKDAVIRLELWFRERPR